MTVKGIIFDINGTLVNIHTDEGNEEIYRGISHFLKYQGLSIHRGPLRDLFFQVMAEQRKGGGEEFPEFDVVGIFRTILARLCAEAGVTLSRAKMAHLPLFLAQMYRGVSLNRLELYPEVRETLESLAPDFALAALTDGQSAWAEPEMRAVSIHHYFTPTLVSGDFGFRKPDPRLYAATLARMGLKAGEVLFVGNDMYRDVWGARQAGMKTVFFRSNQGQQRMDGVEPDYIIYHFGQLLDAVRFFQERP